MARSFLLAAALLAACTLVLATPAQATQCLDFQHNGDGDELADADDPECHTDGNSGNPLSYDPLDNDESS